MENKITFQIPKELEQELKELIRGTNFKSIEEYTLFVLDVIIFEKKKHEKREIYTKKEKVGFARTLSNQLNSPTYTEEEEEGFGGDENEKIYSKKEEADLKHMLKAKGYA